MKEKIIEKVLMDDHVSFVEIERIFKESEFDFEGTHTLRLPKHKNLVVWGDWNETATALVMDIVANQQICLETTGPLIYLIDGGGINLPIAKSIDDYKTEHWIPMVLRDERKTKGKPYTKNDDNYLIDLTPRDRQVVLTWVQEKIYTSQTPLLGCSSYGLKHIMTKDTGIYVTNNQFKDAMMVCGFTPVDDKKLNWNYCISKRSPCFMENHNRKPYCNEIMPKVN